MTILPVNITILPGARIRFENVPYETTEAIQAEARGQIQLVNSTSHLVWHLAEFTLKHPDPITVRRVDKASGSGADRQQLNLHAVSLTHDVISWMRFRIAPSPEPEQIYLWCPAMTRILALNDASDASAG